jgi:hypothetical protein
MPAGRNFSGQIYVATPQLLKAVGITASEVDPSADILTMRPGLSGLSRMQLTYGNSGGGGTFVDPGSGPPPDGGNQSGNSYPCTPAAAWPTRRSRRWAPFPPAPRRPTP